jgi:hypothetical protein
MCGGGATRDGSEGARGLSFAFNTMDTYCTCTSLSVIFFLQRVTDGYDQNYFVDFYTNHVEMV